MEKKRFDEKRVEEAGPNRACAEWLLKCGASIKFRNWGNFVDDFNKIPPGSFEQYLIEEIRAENACIMARGFEYFSNMIKLFFLKKHFLSLKESPRGLNFFPRSFF